MFQWPRGQSVRRSLDLSARRRELAGVLGHVPVLPVVLRELLASGLGEGVEVVAPRERARVVELSHAVDVTQNVVASLVVTHLGGRRAPGGARRWQRARPWRSGTRIAPRCRNRAIRFRPGGVRHRRAVPGVLLHGRLRHLGGARSGGKSQGLAELRPVARPKTRGTTGGAPCEKDGEKNGPARRQAHAHHYSRRTPSRQIGTRELHALLPHAPSRVRVERNGLRRLLPAVDGDSGRLARRPRGTSRNGSRSSRPRRSESSPA